MLSLRSAAFNGNWGESGSNISALHIPTLISIWIGLNIVLRCDSGPHPKIAFMPGQSATFESLSHPCINRFNKHTHFHLNIGLGCTCARHVPEPRPLSRGCQPTLKQNSETVSRGQMTTTPYPRKTLNRNSI